MVIKERKILPFVAVDYRTGMKTKTTTR